MANSLKIGLVGYGEVGKILSRALRQQDIGWVGAWDILMPDGPAMKAHAKDAGVEACASLEDLLGKADIVISAVTASKTMDVARETATYIRPGMYFLDLNSASPGTKAKAATLIDAKGASYVEAGVMTSVPPYGIKVPMLLGGKAAKTLADILTPLGFDAKPVSEELGVASAIKMCRSVMIKGLEAIVIESYTTARRHGVEDYVLPTLKETFPGIDWEKQGTYFFSRVVEHGKRRAEEMREAATTVKEAGFDPWMATATAEKQDFVATLAREGLFKDLAKDAGWRDYADRLINGPKQKKHSA